MQIDVPETLSIEGRADFYDRTGAYRDMIVTPLFQVLGFVAMEPPASLDARHLREETSKVFDALKPVEVRQVVRGQYAGYSGEPGVASGSGTETMAAVRVEVDNWRWAGIPFLLRSGKRLAASRQLITLGFHEPPLRMFPARGTGTPNGRRNEIVIDFADPGSITLGFLAKQPGGRDEPGRCRADIPLRRLLLRRSCSGGLRAAPPGRHARRPVVVHRGIGDRTAVGDLRAAAGEPAPRPALRPRLMGPAALTGPHRRALPLAPARRGTSIVRHSAVHLPVRG